MDKIVHITELPLKDALDILRGKITYQKGEYIEILYGNVWEVQIHKKYGTAIGIDPINLNMAIGKAIGKLKQEI